MTCSKAFEIILGSGESRVKYVGKYRYVFRVFSLVFYKYVHVLIRPVGPCQVRFEQYSSICQACWPLPG